MSRNSSCGSFFSSLRILFSLFFLHISLEMEIVYGWWLIVVQFDLNVFTRISYWTFPPTWYQRNGINSGGIYGFTFLLLACWLAVYQSCNLEDQWLQSFLHWHGPDLEVFGIPVKEVDCYHRKRCSTLVRSKRFLPSRRDGSHNIRHSHIKGVGKCSIISLKSSSRRLAFTFTAFDSCSSLMMTVEILN